MTTYERIFGAGPRGTLISLLLLALAWRLEPTLDFPAITSNEALRWTVFWLSVVVAASLVTWSLLSLPADKRGNILVTGGAFRYFRHPLYAAFLSCLDFGFALLLNNWIYILWAIIVHALWHWNVKSEEALMREAFPEQYADYCKTTGRFIPRFRLPS